MKEFGFLSSRTDNVEAESVLNNFKKGLLKLGIKSSKGNGKDVIELKVMARVNKKKRFKNSLRRSLISKARKTSKCYNPMDDCGFVTITSR